MNDFGKIYMGTFIGIPLSVVTAIIFGFGVGLPWYGVIGAVMFVYFSCVAFGSMMDDACNANFK